MIYFLFEEEIIEVSVKLWSQLSEDDSAVVEMRLARGLPVQSFFSLSAADEDRLEIYGQSGKPLLDRYSADFKLTAPTYEYGRVEQIKPGLSYILSGFKRVIRPMGEPSFLLASNSFVSAAKSGNPGIHPDIEDAYRSLAVIEAMERSALAGESVSPLYNYQLPGDIHPKASIAD